MRFALHGTTRHRRTPELTRTRSAYDPRASFVMSVRIRRQRCKHPLACGQVESARIAKRRAALGPHHVDTVDKHGRRRIAADAVDNRRVNVQRGQAVVDERSGGIGVGASGRREQFDTQVGSLSRDRCGAHSTSMTPAQLSRPQAWVFRTRRISCFIFDCLKTDPQRLTEGLL